MNKTTRREILQGGTGLMLTGLLTGGLEANSRGATWAAGCSDGAVRLWDAQTGKLI